MNDSRDEQFSKLIRQAIKPVKEQELQRDLWPQMLRKIPDSGISVPWFDWVLAALVVIACLFIPESIFGWLLHL
jgi:hypothetical protein